MARARVRRNRRASEISDVILAEWFRVLPESSGAIEPMDLHSLTAAFNEILATRSVAIADGDPDKNEPIKIVVPLPPVKSRAELEDYLEKNGDFTNGMGAAVLFGCGR